MAHGGLGHSRAVSSLDRIDRQAGHRTDVRAEGMSQVHVSHLIVVINEWKRCFGMGVSGPTQPAALLSC